MRSVAIIIPAYNEATRIGAVLDAATKSKLATEIIVVSDGSNDETAAVASKYPGVTVIDLESNIGKGGAMCVGVDACKSEIIAFVDADLVGLRPEHIDRIILPIQQEACEMCLGVFRGGKFWSNTGQLIFPYISGQRALSKELFLRIPHLREVRFGVEIAMHQYVKRLRLRVKRVVLTGVSNSYKEKKYGLVKGVEARSKMWKEMYRAAAMDRRRKHVRRLKKSKLLNISDSEINIALKRLRKKTEEQKIRRKDKEDW